MSDWFVEMGGFYTIKEERIFGRKIYIGPDEFDGVRKRFNNTDVYCTTFCYDGETQDTSNLYGPMYADFDYNIENDRDYQKIKRDVLLVVTGIECTYKIPSKYLKIFFSGHKGFHIIIPAELLGIEPRKDLHLLYKFFADKLNKFTLFKTMDMRIYDNKRLFRLPNSINSKTGLYKVPVSLEFVRNSTYEEMLEYAKVPKDKEPCEAILLTQAKDKFAELHEEFMNMSNEKYSTTKGDRKIKAIPPCILEVLKNGAKKGARNNTAIVVASSLIQNGKSEEELFSILDKWNKEVNVPCLPDREINTVVKSAVRESQLGRRYGCNAIKDLDLCISGDCRFKKAVIR